MRILFLLEHQQFLYKRAVLKIYRKLQKFPGESRATTPQEFDRNERQAEESAENQLNQENSKKVSIKEDIPVDSLLATAEDTEPKSGI